MEFETILPSVFSRPVLTPDIVATLNQTFHNLSSSFVAHEISQYAESPPGTQTIAAILSLTSLLLWLAAGCQQRGLQYFKIDTTQATYLTRSSLAYAFMLCNQETILFDKQTAHRRPQYHETTALTTIMWESAVLGTLGALLLCELLLPAVEDMRMLESWANEVNPSELRYINAVLSWSEWSPWEQSTGASRSGPPKMHYQCELLEEERRAHSKSIAAFVTRQHEGHQPTGALSPNGIFEVAGDMLQFVEGSKCIFCKI